MQIVEGGTKVYKGTNPEVDSYSVFWDNKKLSDTSLCSLLKQKGITDIYVCGLAYDVCVGEYLHSATCEHWKILKQSSWLFLFLSFPCSLGATALDSLSAGYRTVLIDDCCRGVDVTDIEATKEGILTNHGVIVQSKEVRANTSERFISRPSLTSVLLPFAIKTANSGKTFVALMPQFNGWDTI